MDNRRMKDTRKEERRKIMAFTPVYDLEKKTLLGYIGDLTMKGALVVGEKPVDTNVQTTLALDFPETPEFPARRVKIPSRIAWSKHEPDVEYYDTGVEFLEISEPNRTFLESIIERYQYRRVME